ncbi:universal stress protein [Enterococcus rivorum]|uniref:Universal stress protein n=1 Tax=Enterococcus rivorum TaxID=762845 RepID=A0A1E5KTH7_9ENTE|nr:universal stress protein [Enterococcus rivorum]MBP2097963.1 nucleotide-binding universal stress UspA family protein [Enterococcus rivorum]OEH81184.1 hypothetical protein BCR26_04880 [Enterococcus rivorum]
MPNKGSYKNILVAVDGSTASNIAFKEAIYIAKRNNAKLYVAQVINNKLNYLPKESIDILVEDCKNLFQELKDQAKNLDFEDVHSVIEVGSPKEVIATSIPKRENIDLIVLGATGKHFISGALMGSLTYHVAIHAECSVQIVR